MQLCIVGTGYVGLVAGTCLADMGHQVVCVDKDERKVTLLQDGRVPLYEPGLEHLVHRNVREGRLTFTTNGAEAIAQAEVAYIAVGTPSSVDGSADLSGVMAVAEMIGQAMAGPLTVVIKSTVPVGTSARVRGIIRGTTEHDFDVVSNPEFLKEGAAIDDFTRPDRIVVGCEKPETVEVMERIYRPLLRSGKPIFFMDNCSAELTKYASNAFLATRISFINEIALLREKLGADVEMVRKGTGSDSRIGSRFFFPGVGYGGSCFPKDVRALVKTAQDAGSPLKILDAVQAVNAAQKEILANRILARFGADLSGKRFAIWGLAFKPETDDMREAPSLVVIARLLAAGAEVVAYDPEAMEEAEKLLGNTVTLAESPEEAVDGADALLVVTEWNEFRAPDWEDIATRMRQRTVLDGRNIYDPERLRAAGFQYYGVGRREMGSP